MARHNASRIQRLSACLLLVIILTACQGSLQPGGNIPADAPTPTPLPASPALVKATFTVERGEVINEVTFSGRVVPETRSDLFFKSPGRVRTIYVKEGETVEPGQLIADLEGIDDLVRRKELVEIAVRRAEVYLEISQINLKMYKDSTPAWIASYEDYLQIKEREVELAELSVKEARLSLEDLDQALVDAQLFAPIAGEILSLEIRPGGNADAYQVVGEVADTSKLEIAADLLLETRSKLAPGMEATITIGSVTTNTRSAVVRRLPSDPSAVTAGQDADSTTRIALTNPDAAAGLTINQLVNVRVVLEKKADVLWLPPQAVRKFEGRRFVIVLEGSLQRRVDVTIGIESDSRIEIKDGLSEGQTIQGN